MKLREKEGEMETGGLPPGFRFHPTDEELVNYYLRRKIHGLKIELDIIPEVDIYKCEPWELAEKWLLPSREAEWYFFSPRDRKYPNGFRTNRATQGGYWKSTGKDRRVMIGSHRSSIGVKKTLVYYRGRALQGVRTDWIMHEYRLDHEKDPHQQPMMSHQDSYALCRVFKKNATCNGDQGQSSLSFTQSTQGKVNYYETMSHDVHVASSSCIDKDDRDDGWMKFITDDVWCTADLLPFEENNSTATFPN